MGFSEPVRALRIAERRLDEEPDLLLIGAYRVEELADFEFEAVAVAG
jgi:hypothetical protein